jgi:hypothetical protein
LGKKVKTIPFKAKRLVVSQSNTPWHFLGSKVAMILGSAAMKPMDLAAQANPV